MGRSPCCDKNNGLKKGPWTQEEDQIMVDYITKNGYGNWRTLPKNAGLQRCGKSCRLRWTNYLRPDIKRGRFTSEEEDTIIHLHSILGNKWSAIAARLPGRTDNEIKNYWNTHIRKRLLRMGIDPVTHCPCLDLLDLSSLLNSSYYGNPGFNDGCSPGTNYSRCFRSVGDYNPVINPDLLKLATTLFSSQHHVNSNLAQPSDGQVQVQGNTFEQSQFGCDQGGIQFAQGLSQMEQMNDDWESRSGLYTTSLDEDYSKIDFPSDIYYGSLDDPTLVEENIPTFNSYHGSTYRNHFISSCSPPQLTSNSNSTTTYINGSINEDEREISYCSGNDMVARFEMAPVDSAFDDVLSGFI